MQKKLKVVTIGDYRDSILEKSFKDNKDIEFLELALNEKIENLNTNFSKQDIVFLRTNTDNLEKLLEIGKTFKEKEIIENLNYPFYNKTLKDSKKILIFLDTLEEVELTESQIITDVLMDETKNKIKDVMFSMRIENR